MTVPYYFLNRYMLRKIRPRDGGKNLLAYLLLTVIAAFLYISAGIWLVIRIAAYYR
jgi:hypothetical protein